MGVSETTMPSHLPYSHHERAFTKGTALDRSINNPFGRSDHLEPEMRPAEYVDQKLKEAYKFHNVEPDWGLEKEVVFLERRPYAAALLDCAEKAVKAAGTLISAAYAKKSKPCFETKSNTTDPVTELDQRCEDLIVTMIKERYSGHAIIGEESSANDVDLRSTMTEDPTWIIDPLDGTTNYVHGIPTCAVSVGVYVCNSPVAAAVYFPLTDELFSATTRGGAFLNGNKCRTRRGCWWQGKHKLFAYQEAAAPTYVWLLVAGWMRILRVATALTAQNLGTWQQGHSFCKRLEDGSVASTGPNWTFSVDEQLRQPQRNSVTNCLS